MYTHVRFEVFTAVTMKNCCLLRCYAVWLVTASVVPSSPILVTLMNEALNSSETSVLTRTTRRNIPEDTILYVYTCYPQNYWVSGLSVDGY
jgi:hypothetical protein